jgi:glycosyltransferase involved in cell wall biosynthesis
MKKIVFIISSLGSGGAERVVSILANGFFNRGYNVSIVMVVNHNISYEISDRINLIALDCNDSNKKSAFARYEERLVKIKKAVNRIQPDIVVSFMSTINIDVCLALWGINVPIVVSERNDPAVDPRSKLKQLVRRIVYRRANGFVFQTPDARDYFSKRIQSKSEVILNPMSAEMPYPFDGERENRIVAVGRLNRQKNYPLLLKAFDRISSEFPDYTLHIYGEGEMRKDIEHQIAESEAKERIVLHGFCKNVHDEILKAALFVMTSDFEGLPNALIEAMALGLPVISTDCPCGGPRMVIRNNKNGLLVPVGDLKALTESMQCLLTDSDKRETMGLEARKVREELQRDRIIDKWEYYLKRCGL